MSGCTLSSTSKRAFLQPYLRTPWELLTVNSRFMRLMLAVQPLDNCARGHAAAAAHGL